MIAYCTAAVSRNSIDLTWLVRVAEVVHDLAADGDTVRYMGGTGSEV
jgi:hypothetical protein